MKLFGRAKASPVLLADLPPGEHPDRAVRAIMLRGKAWMKGSLFMTNRRLLFEAEKGDARWLTVPFGEVRSSGIFPAPQPVIGRPGVGGAQCLFVETTDGEHVWWSFDRKAEDEWLAIVKERAPDENDAGD
jgi:hypothetical protein